MQVSLLELQDTHHLTSMRRECFFLHHQIHEMHTLLLSQNNLHESQTPNMAGNLPLIP